MARDILGSDKLVCPEQMVLPETSPIEARAIGRRTVSRYLLPNYCKNFLRMGFTEADLTGGGSDRLVDALIAWGDAGADHVCIQPLAREGLTATPADEKILELLALSAEH